MPSILRSFARLALALGLALPAAAAPMTFVMVPKGVHPYYQPCFEGFKAAAEQYGVTADIVEPAKFELPLQVQIIRNLIARKVDGIAVSALGDAGLAPVIAEATRAGIKVITFDSGAPSTQALTYIGTNNRRAGYQAGRRMAAVMKGTGKLVVLQGGMSAANLNQRTLGFKRALAKFGPGIKLLKVVDVEGDATVAARRTEELLRDIPDLDAIFSVSAEGAPAAASVIKQSPKAGKIVVAGFDDLDATLEGIRQGSISFCLVQKTFKMGWMSVEALMDATKGQPLPKETDTRVMVVNGANVEHYQDDLRRELLH